MRCGKILPTIPLDPIGCSDPLILPVLNRKKTGKEKSAYPPIRRKIPDPKFSLDEIVRPHVPKSPKIRRVKDEQLAIAAVESVAPAEAQPFLKWVGGKAQLLTKFDQFFPTQVGRYFEPFIGGGAVFFHLKHRFPQMRAFLRDINPELINTYLAVRDFPQELMRRLNDHAAHFSADRENYYYLVRAQHTIPEKEVIERAARMIFLNKTCFNGLWRVNAHGKFNVPIGSTTKLNNEAQQRSSTTKLNNEAQQRSSTTKLNNEAQQRSSMTRRIFLRRAGLWKMSTCPRKTSAPR